MACNNCICPNCLSDDLEFAEPAYPDVTVTDRWVAVQFHERGPALVLEEDGTVTERFLIPSDVAQLPLPATSRPIVTLHLPGDAA